MTDFKEASLRHIQNAIESVLTLGDFQKEVESECTPQRIASETIQRIAHIIGFDASAIYLVDEQTSDLRLMANIPADAGGRLEEELAFMIENGFVAWAMRERRGITVNAKDGSRQVLLHGMATYSRIRGLFVGIFPTRPLKVQDASPQILSIILRNAANGIESLGYGSMLRQRQLAVEEEVERKASRIAHYEKQLLQAQNLETIAALAGGVAHQFNNALQILSGSIDLLGMIARDDAKIMPHVDRTRVIVDKMANLTHQLTVYAQGGTFIANQSVTLKALFDEILPGARRSVKATVQISVDLPDERIAVDVDLLQLRTVFTAILANADEAIAEKGAIRISGRRCAWNDLPENVKGDLSPGAYVRLDFQDDGSGMDGDTLRRLFEPFYSTKFAGRGLSMAAVSGIIRRHNGWIGAASQVGEGTRIEIYLPEAS